MHYNFCKPGPIPIASGTGQLLKGEVAKDQKLSAGPRWRLPRVAIGNAERVRFYCLFPRTGFTPLLLSFLQTEQRMETRGFGKANRVLSWILDGDPEKSWGEVQIGRCFLELNFSLVRELVARNYTNYSSSFN